MNTHTFTVPDGILKLTFFADNGVRVTHSPEGREPHTLTVPELPATHHAIRHDETAERTRLSAPGIAVEIEHATGRLHFFDADQKPILSEPREGARWTAEEEIAGHTLTARRQTFLFSRKDDSLHGLGHQLDAGWNFRGRSLDLLQENTTIVVPFLYNSAGCGILWDNASHSALGNPVRPVPSECWQTPDGVSGGLQCETFRDEAFTDLRKTETDPTISHQWWSIVEGWHSATDAPEEPFHMRWSGFLVPRHSGTHQIYLDLPVGGDLWLEGEKILSYRHSHKRRKLSIDLEAGKAYAFRLETPQGTSWLGAYAHFQWQEPVPSDRFSFWSQHAPAADYYVMAGTPHEILAAYNRLTGPAPLMPRYLFGYWQSREHYKDKDELVGVVEGHRSRGIPIDVVVQDWLYWAPRTWGEPWFDPERFPNHPEIFRDLHERLHCHLMLSNYAQVAEESFLYPEFSEKGYLLPNAKREGAYWIDPYNPEAIQTYWDRTRSVYFDAGVDIFWLDTTEPKITHPLTPEALLTGLSPNHHGNAADVLNAFSLYLCRGYYEAQRAAGRDRRVCLHPRSGFAGQQRYAAAVWTGDTEGSWEALREQIPMALNMAFCGIPYWNTDIGGFLGRNPEDPDYRELFIRWFQFGTFCPIMRNHGTCDPKEIWRFGEEAEAILRDWIELHYQFLPYFYSLSRENHLTGLPFIRPLLMEFPDDPAAGGVADAFLFGPGLLVAPVTDPGVTSRPVYLPAGTDWYDFWTGERHPGGQTLQADAPLAKLPVYVRAGTILPLEPNRLQHTGEYTGEKLELRVYPGADGHFTLYEDSGDGYQYEDGEFLELPMHWEEATATLSLDPTRGTFPGACQTREIKLTHPAYTETLLCDPSGCKKSFPPFPVR
jgi:alpha-D-xyloside xylohydrolase